MMEGKKGREQRRGDRDGREKRRGKNGGAPQDEALLLMRKPQ